MGYSYIQHPNSAKERILQERSHGAVAAFRGTSLLTFFLQILLFILLNLSAQGLQ